MRTTLLIGPPGTGKTTSCLDLVDQALHDGVDPNRIAYLAFTKKAATEATTRACHRFDLTAKDFPYFRTLHSLAFRELALTRDEVMTTDDFQELGSVLGGYTFKNQYDETLERAPMGGGLGDKCLSLYGLARAHKISPRKIWERSHQPGMDWPTLHRFVATLDAYKAHNGKFDFSDFMDDCKSILDVDLFILDEAQDLTNQQWVFAKQLAATAGKVYIAGDDDQAIFQWAGADLRRLFSIAGDRQVLPTSHRLPRQVFNLADRLVKRITPRFPKDWAPRDAEGMVKQAVSLEQVDLSDGSWLLLGRNRHFLKDISAFCRAQGVVYKFDGRWSNDHPTVKAVIAYEQLRRGDVLTKREARLVAKYAIADLSDDEKESYVWEDFLWPFEERPDWMTAMRRLGDEAFEYIRRVRRRGESLTKPGRIVISTIHGVKGGEADNVLLLPDMSKKVYEGMLHDPAAEARVWYVAATRARQNLFVAAPKSKRFYTLH
jgi:superfamily I DNA/RNA helicase